MKGTREERELRYALVARDYWRQQAEAAEQRIADREREISQLLHTVGRMKEKHEQLNYRLGDAWEEAWEEGVEYGSTWAPWEVDQRARELVRRRRSIAIEARRLVLERDGRRCLRCGATERLHLDHVIPWSQGGADHVDNLQTLCEACNGLKRTRSLDYRVSS